MRGKAIAEVEPREKAEQHAAALVKQGLIATVESIG
jgi:ATP-dependent Clp protease adapter protein ClpS